MPKQNLPDTFHRPLAERMRPQSLEELVGQEHLLGEGRPLRRLIDSDRLTSMILWGPPGSGKTTLARLLAELSSAHFTPFSAVLDGVKDLRARVAEAQERRQQNPASRTLLFVDEIHRFNKAQQDAFLPHVESGLVTLVGATTENPSFHVIGPLMSRCALHLLKPLEVSQLKDLMLRALSDDERGLGTLSLRLSDEALSRLVLSTAGDARRALGALERVALHFRARPLDQTLEIEDLAAALGESSLLYDRSGDEHYNVVSAFIKSMRGSDPNAALYYLARMIEAGEDPLFVARRLVIFASEDVGLADPRAVQVAVACKDAVHFLGLPEAKYPLSQATLYLSTAPKSDSTKGYFKAAKAVRTEGSLPVPMHLRNAATSLMKTLGYGDDYDNPHRFEGEYVAQNYLPEAVDQEVFYTPSDQGYERMVSERLDAWSSAKAEGYRRKKPR